MDATLRDQQISAWLKEIMPSRVLFLGGRNELHDRAGQLVDASLSSIVGPDPEWIDRLPARFRPTVVTTELGNVRSLDPGATFDLGICLAELAELPVGLAKTLLSDYRRRCRFLIVMLRLPRSRREGSADPTVWNDCDLSELSVLDRCQGESCAMFLLRGGSDVRRDRAFSRVFYLSPSREIRGGLKILYNHVEILNSVGIPAVLTVREPHNNPASWFPWDPRFQVFDHSAARRTTSRDVVVIPEFRFREVKKYEHVGKRLLFVQNPGLCFEIDRWRQMGFDGVLTLNCPDGRQSQMHSFVAERTDLPIFAISNHYSDDPWGTACVDREPGRILCLPRKGPEFIERLRQEFRGIATVDNVPQTRMAVEYARSDIYVHTGFPEGQPMPPIEAMLSGCLVCGFTGQGGLDVMRDGETAYVAEDGNHEQLVAAVRRALTDPNREQVRAAGTALCQSFHRAVTTAELRRCYTSWLPTLPKRRPSVLHRLAGTWHRMRAH